MSVIILIAIGVGELRVIAHNAESLTVVGALVGADQVAENRPLSGHELLNESGGLNRPARY